MLGALAGGDAFQIIVALKDLSTAGFAKVKSEIKSTESVANSTNLGGFSKAAKTAEADAEKAAGTKDGGGIAGMASGLVGLAGGPVTLAVAGIGAVAAAGFALTQTYDQVEVQEKALATAAKDHGIALGDLNSFVDEAISKNAQYGFGADDTRAAITQLTEAGVGLADQQDAMNAIADLAAAKNISLADASQQYTLAIAGSTRALKEYGITLPKVGADQAAVTSAQKAATSASSQLTSAHNALQMTEAELAGKHKLTAAEALRLQLAHERVDEAEKKLKAAHEHLAAAQSKTNDTGGRAKLVSDAITKAVGDQRTAVSPLAVAQAQLGDAWERMSTVVGPPLIAVFTAVVQAIASLVQWIADALQWVQNLGNAFGALLVGPLKAVIDAISTVSGFVGSIGNAIGGALPHFASGGVVEPRPGGRLIVAGDAGEREYVIPESRMGSIGGRSSTVVHTVIQLDGRTVAEVVDEHLGLTGNLLGGSSMFPVGA